MNEISTIKINQQQTIKNIENYILEYSELPNLIAAVDLLILCFSLFLICLVEYS
jgi:hypothetical protein